MLPGLVYFGTYALAFPLFMAISWRVIRDLRARHTYGVMLAAAYLGGMFFAAHALSYVVRDASLANHGAREFGAWLAEHDVSSVGDVGAMFMQLMSSGSGLWGGPLFVVLLVMLFLVLLRAPVADKEAMGDATAVALPFSLALAKVGCFSAGCCYGFEGSGWFCITNTWAENADRSSRFPTQLADLVAYTAIGCALLLWRRRGAAKGRLLAWFVLLFAAARFTTEATRGDGLDEAIMGLSPVQLVLIGGVILTLPLVLYRDLLPRLLRIRSVAEPAPPDALDSRGNVHLIVLVAATVLWIPLPLMVPIFAAMMVWTWFGPRRPLRQALDATCLLAGMLWFTSFAIPSLVPFLLLAPIAAVAVPLLVSRGLARPRAPELRA